MNTWIVLLKFSILLYLPYRPTSSAALPVFLANFLHIIQYEAKKRGSRKEHGRKVEKM